jgi:hypothetical protein
MGDWQGRAYALPIFFSLGIVSLVNDLNNDKQKNRKKKMKCLLFMGPILPSFKFDSFVK